MLKCWIPKAAYQILPPHLESTLSSKPKHPRRSQPQPTPKQVWIPKHTAAIQAPKSLNPDTISCSHTPPRQHQRHSSKCQWILKATLKAQGFYEGRTILWLPKPDQTPKPKSCASPIPNAHPQPQSSIPTMQSPSQEDFVHAFTIKERARILQQRLWGHFSTGCSLQDERKNTC